MCLEEGPGPRQTGEPRCTPQGNAQHRNSLQQSENKNKNTNKKLRTASHREWEEYDVQSYQIIRFKSPVSNHKKKSQGIQKNRRVWPISRKK